MDTDPTTTMQLSAFSNYAGGSTAPEDVPDTGLRILKYETGTEFPLSGARFEVIGPDGDTVGIFATNGNGEILIPLLLSGNYTVIERDSPAYHLLSDEPTQNVAVRYGEVAEVTYYNAPYGNLTVEKEQDMVQLYFGNSPKGALLIKKIDSGIPKPAPGTAYHPQAGLRHQKATGGRASQDHLCK